MKSQEKYIRRILATSYELKIALNMRARACVCVWITNDTSIAGEYVI